MTANMVSLMETKHITDIFIKLMQKLMNEDLCSCNSNLTLAQINALKFIKTHEPCTISSLAQGLGISQPATTMLVDRMCKRELVVRRSSDDDRRQMFLSITSKAQNIIAQIDLKRITRFGAILDIMDTESRNALVEALSGFVEAAIKAYPQAYNSCLQCGDDHSADCVVSRALEDLPDANK